MKMLVIWSLMLSSLGFAEKFVNVALNTTMLSFSQE